MFYGVQVEDRAIRARIGSKLGAANVLGQLEPITDLYAI